MRLIGNPLSRFVNLKLENVGREWRAKVDEYLIRHSPILRLLLHDIGAARPVINNGRKYYVTRLH